MRVVLPAVARVARFAIPSFALVSIAAITGCATSSFAGAAPGYDEQACVERALRRTHDPVLVSHANAQFREECFAGGAEACSALGVMTELGVGVPANAGQAIALYQRSCNAGNSHGCANLGVAMAEGIGGVRDSAAAARLLEPACDRNDARACFYLARMTRVGAGVAMDMALSVHLFELSCAGDEASACLALGEQRSDEGKAADAAIFYGKACSLGDALGCKRLDAPIERARRDELASSDGR